MTHYRSRGSRWPAILAVFLLSACAAPPPPPTVTNFPDRVAERSFATVFQNVADRYLEEISVEDLAMEGLRGITSLDSGITVQQAVGTIELSRGGTLIATFTAPGPNDARGWSRVTTNVLVAAKRHSLSIRTSAPEKIYEAVFDGSLGLLDSFSRYASPGQARENRAKRSGYIGIGVRYSDHSQGVIVVELFPNGPATKAGLRKNDVITHVDGGLIAGLEKNEIRSRLRGNANSTISLIVERAGMREPFTVNVKSSRVIAPTVRYAERNGILHIGISGFNERTARSLEQRLRTIRRTMHSRARGIVMDLRGNPGGLLKQAVGVANLFLARGRIVATQGRHPDSSHDYTARGIDVVAGLPVVILMNGRSASASEIVAAALQDHERAIIVGTGSFGKGTVQSVTPLPNKGEMTLTWSRFLTPSGYVLHGLGVAPSICTSAASGSARTLINRTLDGTYKVASMAEAWRQVNKNDARKRKDLRALCPAKSIKAKVDQDIAVLLLKNQDLYRQIRSLAANAVLSAR